MQEFFCGFAFSVIGKAFMFAVMLDALSLCCASFWSNLVHGSLLWFHVYMRIWYPPRIDVDSGVHGDAIFVCTQRRCER